MPALEFLGVRVPTLVASPWVAPRSVDKTLFDPTSILQLLAERFARSAADYSDEVNRRIDQGIASASVFLTQDQPRAEISRAPAVSIAARSVVRDHGQVADNDNQVAFGRVARQLVAERREPALERFPELAQLPPEEPGE